jgi:sugar phosphate isomerase/epimerase
MISARIGLTQWSLDLADARFIAACADLGVDCCQLEYDSRLDRPHWRAEYVKAAETSGVALVAIAANGLSEMGLGRVGSASMREARGAVEAAEAMSIPVVQIPCFEQSAIRTSADWRHTIDFLRLVCEFAAARGVLVANENVLPAAQQIAMVEAVDAPNFRLLYDVLNPTLAGQDAAGLLRAVAAHLCPVMHVKDGRDSFTGDRLLGSGRADFPAFFTVLAETNFHGALLIENEYQYIEHPGGQGVKDDIAFLKAALQPYAP